MSSVKLPYALKINSTDINDKKLWNDIYADYKKYNEINILQYSNNDIFAINKITEISEKIKVCIGNIMNTLYNEKELYTDEKYIKNSNRNASFGNLIDVNILKKI